MGLILFSFFFFYKFSDVTRHENRPIDLCPKEVARKQVFAEATVNTQTCLLSKTRVETKDSPKC